MDYFYIDSTYYSKYQDFNEAKLYELINHYNEKIEKLIKSFSELWKIRVKMAKCKSNKEELDKEINFSSIMLQAEKNILKELETSYELLRNFENFLYIIQTIKSCPNGFVENYFSNKDFEEAGKQYAECMTKPDYMDSYDFYKWAEKLLLFNKK